MSEVGDEEPEVVFITTRSGLKVSSGDTAKVASKRPKKEIKEEELGSIVSAEEVAPMLIKEENKEEDTNISTEAIVEDEDADDGPVDYQRGWTPQSNQPLHSCPHCLDSEDMENHEHPNEPDVWD